MYTPLDGGRKEQAGKSYAADRRQARAGTRHLSKIFKYVHTYKLLVVLTY